MITPSLIHDIASLAAIEPEWRLLWERCPEATPFQHPAWLLPWCRHFAPRLLSVIALRRGGRLVGLLPSFPRAVGDSAPRALLGEGISDYLDALLDPAHLEESLATLGAQLVDLGGAYDFHDLCASSPLLRLPSLRGYTDTTEATDVCPLLRLSNPLARLDAAVPRETLRNVRRARARAAASGRLTHRLADAGSRADLLEALFALHGARWRLRGESGVLAQGAIRAFHEEASTALLDAGMLRLFGVFLDDAPIAALIALFARGRAYLYLQGFDPALERLSPGLLATACAVEQACTEGASAVDFLRGRERYKHLWGARDELTYRRTLTPL